MNPLTPFLVLSLLANGLLLFILRRKVDDNSKLRDARDLRLRIDSECDRRGHVRPGA